MKFRKKEKLAMKKVSFFLVAWTLCVSLFVSDSFANIILSDIEEESPGVWGIEINDHYVPERGGIKVCKAENKVIVGFYLSDDNMSFYKQEFSSGNRKPIGFEFLIIDHSGVFNRDNVLSIETDFPGDLRYDENYQWDESNRYTLAINDPSQLDINKWYTATFRFSSHVDVSEALFEVVIKLVGDVRTLKNDFASTYDQYGLLLKAEFLAWLTVNDDIDGNNFFSIRTPRLSLFYENSFFVGYDRFLWSMEEGQVGDFEPYECEFGSDPWVNDPGNSGDPITQESIVGSGTESVPDPEEVPEPTYPNFEGVESKLATLSGQEKYEWYKPEEMYMHLWFQNDGDADWEGDHDYAEVRYYLSKGEKVDPSSERERVGIDYIQKYNLELGDEPKHEDDRLILLNKDSIQPGNYYNIVGCVDRTADENNGEGDVNEIHESDNCTTEAVFYVAETPTQFFSDDQTFGWSNAGTIDGMVCTHILETADPDSWDNNYLCTQNNEGIVWNSSGTVAGMRCYQVSESADPDTWHDNYLCVPEQSNLQFYWSSDERVSGEDCVQWFEPYDPYTWDDNYLCFDRDYVYVPPPPPPSIVVTNPESTDNWRSDSTKHIRWDRYNFPVQGSVKIEYSMDGGGSWRTIDSSTNNDGSRYWDMCNSYTTDSPNSYVRITSNEYGVSGTSQKFYIDHARGCD
ncbi:hypothetical protein ACFL2R_01170 [Patescibacteria group bacterium]